ncbi:MAG TPA: HAMP domain-containing sensor histidine kinase [Opitutaceae bacterium]|jgi:signal transduction histidine kinase
MAPEDGRSGVASFRLKLLVAMMLVVSAAAISVLLVTQRYMAASVRLDFQREFQNELLALHSVQSVRHAALAERCRELARRPRIHAALEDGALDLLYPSARDELADVMEPAPGLARDQASHALKARYYRFLDARGRVIEPPDPRDVGALTAGEEQQLNLARLPDAPQSGYVRRGDSVDEVIAMPIVSTETGETISAIVLGFKPPVLGGEGAAGWVEGGVWLGGSLDLPSLGAPARDALDAQLSREVGERSGEHGEFDFSQGGAPFLVSYERLNPGSLYPAAFEVSVYPLAESVSRVRRLIWGTAGAAALLLLAAFAVSHFLSRRLSAPVERLAVDSEENREHWHRAEAALETTSQELQRSARFSADASHQLKTPVTVLRAGLEGLLAGHALAPEAREEVSALVHQTFRLATVIEDLLLLSRMDAGRLRIQFSRLDLAPVLEALLDDLGALPDIFDLEIDTDLPASLPVKGEKRYAELILQNLLENARKYNRTGGKVTVSAALKEDMVVVRVGNTGPGIPQQSQAHIFERFHRGAIGENVPGHGIGLNLARELAILHGGDLRLLSSGDDWTEFELRLRSAGEAGE